MDTWHTHYTHIIHTHCKASKNAHVHVLWEDMLTPGDTMLECRKEEKKTVGINDGAGCAVAKTQYFSASIDGGLKPFEHDLSQ